MGCTWPYMPNRAAVVAWLKAAGWIERPDGKWQNDYKADQPPIICDYRRAIYRQKRRRGAQKMWNDRRAKAAKAS